MHQQQGQQQQGQQQQQRSRRSDKPMERQQRHLPVLLLVLLTFAPLACLADSSSSSSTNSSSSSDNKLLCMAEMVSNIESSCSRPDVQGYYVALENLLKDYLGRCFHTNFTQNRALHVMMPDISPDVTALLKSRAADFKSFSSREVVPTFVPATQINSEVEFELHNNLNYSHDGWILDPSGIAKIFSYSGLLDLRSNVTDEANQVNWTDVLPFLRNYSAVFNRQVVVLPLDGNVQVLYYRADVFAARNLTVPRTWDDLVALARAMNGTDLDGDPTTQDYSFCYERRKDCGTLAFDLMSIAAPALQYEGTSQGLFFDPVAIATAAGFYASPLVDNPAMARALAQYAALAALSPSTLPGGLNNVNEKCGSSSMVQGMMAAGRCLMAVGQGDYFKLSKNSSVSGRLGVARVPGSPDVYDRSAAALAPCTPTLCKYSELDAQSGRWINFAPYTGSGGWVAAVNQRSPTEYRTLSILFFMYVFRPDFSWNLTLTATSMDPYRYQHFQNVTRWVTDGGFNANDTAAYLAAARASLEHPNIGLDLRVAGTSNFRDIYASGAANATQTPDNITAVLAQMSSAMARLLADPQKVTPLQLAADYRSAIQYGISDAGGQPTGSDDDDDHSPSWLPIVIVLPVVLVVLAAAGLAVYHVRNTRKHKSLFGKVLPPGLGSDTTIMVLEVEDGAAVLEALPAEAADRMLRELGDCVRRLLLKHSGYESCCDQESFTLAFHSPKDALLFAMDCQASLLPLDWPAELRALPHCATVAVQSITRDAKPKHLNDILDADPALVAAPLPAGASKIRALAHGLPLGGGLHGHGSHGHAHHDAHVHTLPSLVNVPASETYTFAEACQRAWKAAQANDPQRITIFRGPRVRMGMHAGVHCESDIVSSAGRAVNSTGGGGAFTTGTSTKQQQAAAASAGDAGQRTVTYCGETVALARAVVGAASGGMVLLSEETYKKLPLERLWDKFLVLHVGEHRLASHLPTLNLYHALNRTLEGRLAHLGTVKSQLQLDPGVLDAPVGCVTVAFMNVVGAQTLLGWNADVAQHAIKIFQQVVGEELKRRKGYLVEAVDGLFLAAFQRPSDAVLWALDCNEAMVRQEWPEELLAHELCEELAVSAPTKEGEVVNTVVFRGLRVKTGVDTGQVLGEVHAMTGRMTYRGKVMNRAARIASTASTGQVLCSSDGWSLATANDAALLAHAKVSGNSLGQFRLKGVADKIEIVQCRKAASPGGGGALRRGTSLVMSMSEHWQWEQAVNQPIGPDDIILGPTDAIRAAMLGGGPHHSFSNHRMGTVGSGLAAPADVAMGPLGVHVGALTRDEEEGGTDDEDDDGDLSSHMHIGGDEEEDLEIMGGGEDDDGMHGEDGGGGGGARRAALAAAALQRHRHGAASLHVDDDDDDEDDADDDDDEDHDDDGHGGRRDVAFGSSSRAELAPAHSSQQLPSRSDGE